MKRIFIMLLVFAVAGCANKSIFIEPSNRADQMLFYVEQDRSGKKHPISNSILDNKETTRIPRPALVDIDSLIHINVRKPPGDSSQNIFKDEADKLAAEKASVLELMRKLEQLVEARGRAFDAYRDGNPSSDFDDIVHESAQKTREFIKEFRMRYPRGSDGYRAANRAIGAGGIGMLRPFLQGEIDEIQMQDKRIKERARSRSSKLKLEAFLDTPGGELTALHLPGYDSLAEGRVATRDRSGLKLSEQERSELSRQIKATEDIARTLDAVREKEKTLQVGVKDTLVIVAPDLARQVAVAEEVVARLRDPERITSIKADIRRAVSEAMNQTNNLSQGVRNRLEALPETLVTVLQGQAVEIEKVLQIVTSANQLKQDWKQFRNTGNLEAMPALLGQIEVLRTNLNDAARSLPKRLYEAGDLSALLVSGEIEGIESEASKVLADWLEGEFVSETMSEAQSYYADIRKGAATISEIAGILKIGSVDVASVAPDVPQAFFVDIELLQDTVLDLRRVPGNDGDTILVRAHLYDPGRRTVEASSTFELTHYDYFARLVPSVVLVRPDEIASGEDDFRFAPALGWMHHYRPRPEADSWYANVARPLQVAAGLHAIFLNFDNESGIGLGGTISFWNDRLQFGAGWNLSANSSDEGRHYFFVGSDLIGLLQTVGVGN